MEIDENHTFQHIKKRLQKLLSDHGVYTLNIRFYVRNIEITKTTQLKYLKFENILCKIKRTNLRTVLEEDEPILTCQSCNQQYCDARIQKCSQCSTFIK